MKTTLKRGIGRAAELNGNGRAVYPPAVAAPMTRYRQPEPAKRSLGVLFGKIVLWIVIVALMLAGGIAGGRHLYVEQDIAALTQATSCAVYIANDAATVTCYKETPKRTSGPFTATDDGLPIGIQLIGRAADEATLIRLSAQLEEARPWADRTPLAQ